MAVDKKDTRPRSRLVLENASVTLRSVQDPDGSVTVSLVVRAGPKTRIAAIRPAAPAKKPKKRKKRTR